jgi:hypothetical protein
MRPAEKQECASHRRRRADVNNLRVASTDLAAMTFTCPLRLPLSCFEVESERRWSSTLPIWDYGSMIIKLACQSAIIQAHGIHSG